MSTITFSKVLSIGSSSEVPTPPHPTPALGHQHTNEDCCMPVPDLMAVSKTLAPIEEELNEKADEAMYPTPPVQTPEAFSPAPSVVVRQYTRARGLSFLPERLAQIQLEETATDDTASSYHSTTLSQDEEGNIGSGSITIGLGSPTVNPRLEEYLAHPPPRTAPIPLNTTGQDSNNREGVREASTWSDVALSDLVEALERLEQVVADLQEQDGCPAVDRYMTCLNLVLMHPDRKYPAKAVLEEKK